MGRLRYHCLSGLLLLLALAARAEEATTATVPCDKDDDEHKQDKFEHFTEIFYTVLFIVLVWISGKIAAAAGAPSLVGEILVGVILGPHVVDFVPFPSALKSIGEVGLCLHALEAGLMVDVCVEINQCAGCTAVLPRCWLGRAVRNEQHHAIEQASRRWRAGRLDDSANAP